MKIFSTLALASLALAVLAAETVDAAAQPVVKHAQLQKQQPSHKLRASDLNELDDANVLSDPLGPIGTTFGMDDDLGAPPVTGAPEKDASSSGSGESDDWSGSGSGTDEDSSANGSGDDDENGSADSSDGSNAPATKETAVHHQLHAAHDNDAVHWELFDKTGSDGSDGSQEDDESSGSGSNEDAEGSGSNDSGSGDDEPTTTMPPINTLGIDGDGELDGEHPPTKAHKKSHEAKAAGLELASRASAESVSFKNAQKYAVYGSVAGAAIGAIAAVMGVAHLRRQQQRDAQSTLAEELPEPQTGREDGEFEPVGGAPDDELAASSIDLEEALTSEENAHDEEEEGAFANDTVV